MARIAAKDCLEKVFNRFELVVLGDVIFPQDEMLLTVQVNFSSRILPKKYLVSGFYVEGNYLPLF